MTQTHTEAQEAQLTSRTGVRERASRLRASAYDRADRAMSSTGRGLERAGGRVQDAAGALSSRFERAGHYLQEHDFEELTNDMTEVIRRHPMKSLLIGAGIGYLIGRMRYR